MSDTYNIKTEEGILKEKMFDIDVQVGYVNNSLLYNHNIIGYNISLILQDVLFCVIFM